MITELRDKQRIPLDRLSKYYEVFVKNKQLSETTIDDIIVQFDDISKKQLREDCTVLNIENLPKINIDSIIRKVRRELYHFDHSIINNKPNLEGLENFDALNSLILSKAGMNDLKETRLIEKTFNFLEGDSKYFLIGNGIINKSKVPYRHQIEEAKRIIEELLANAIVVHEVGLGKTITAIIVLAELLVIKPELSVLILVPSNLRKQWYTELKSWIDLPDINIREPFHAKKIHVSKYLLLSIDTAKEDKWAKILTNRNWDIAIIDECHLLRNDATKRYAFVYSINAKEKLFLTATPVHNSGYDIYHQINLVRPGYLARKAIFEENYIRGERQIVDSDILQEKLKSIISQRRREETDLYFPKRKIEEISIKKRSEAEKALYDDVLKLLQGIYKRHLGSSVFIIRPSGKEQGISQIVLVSILVLRELSSHPNSALRTLDGALLKAVEELSNTTGDTSDLMHLEKLLKKYKEIDFTNGNHNKTEKLIELIPEYVKKYKKVIVYVEFRETQKAIIKRLMKRRKVGLPSNTAIISYHGSLTQEDKDYQIFRFFDSDFACFVSTDAGGQGLNLQSANEETFNMNTKKNYEGTNIVINFDFPWNPMKIEQRIGRIDRIGQTKKSIDIKNFFTYGTIEEYVYKILTEKLKVCDDVLGQLVPKIFDINYLYNLSSDPEDILGIGKIILSSKNEEELENRFLEFRNMIDKNFEVKKTNWKPKKRWIDE